MNYEEKMLIVESGLGGHILHLYEDETLTFSDIKNVFSMAADGKLANITEKIDGVNLFITWDVAVNELKVARNKGNLDSGGMDRDMLEKKFSSGYPESVKDAFLGGYDILSRGLKDLGTNLLTKIFGLNKNQWFSIEISTIKNTNTVSYNQNIIVLHKSSNETSFEALVNVLPQIQNTISDLSWKILAPVSIQIRKSADKTFLLTALNKIQQIQSHYGLVDSNTIKDFIQTRLQIDVVAQLPLFKEMQVTLVKKLSGDVSTKSFEQMKAIIPTELHNKIDILIKNKNSIHKEVISPLQQIETEFATNLLSNVQSQISTNPKSQSIKDLVSAASSAIQMSGNQKNIDSLNKYLSHLPMSSISDKVISIEGITFQYKNKMYKFTGIFQDLNQILNIGKHSK